MATIGSDSECKAHVIAKSDIVVAGLPYFGRVFQFLDPRVELEELVSEGQQVNAGTSLVNLRGPTRSVLTGERVALNILQRLTGVATMTRRYAEALTGTNTRVVDTRKTTPGMRTMQKYAVRMGGGSNHRFGLDSGILIKDNHIAACGSLTLAVQRVREESPHVLRIEVETKTLEEVDEAIACKADVILLDNMSLELLKESVRRVQSAGKGILTEASGNVTLAKIRTLAETGVDFISVGALTHSVAAADLSLKVLS
jgi:nicotinate-nucleotide pyrophosphorylase (carboxylating)